MQRNVIRESEKKKVEDKWVIGKAEEPAKVCNVHLLKEQQSERSVISDMEKEMIAHQPVSIVMCAGMQQYGRMDRWLDLWRSGT